MTKLGHRHQGQGQGQGGIIVRDQALTLNLALTRHQVAAALRELATPTAPPTAPTTPAAPAAPAEPAARAAPASPAAPAAAASDTFWQSIAEQSREALWPAL